VLAQPMRLERGVAHASSAPGHGVLLDRNALAPYEVDAESLRHLLEGEQALAPEAIEAVCEAMCRADSVDDEGGERVAHDGLQATGVEDGGDLTVVMGVEQLVDRGEDLRTSAPQVGSRKANRHPKCGRLAGAQPQADGDLTVLTCKGDVLDDEPGHALALPLRGAGVGPQGGEVGGERGDAGAVGLGEPSRPAATAFVVLLGGGEGAQRLVPVGLQAGGHEPVVGIHAEVASAGRLRGVAGPLDVLAPKGVGLAGTGLELGMHRQGDLQGERGDAVQQQLADCGVHSGAVDPGAQFDAALDRVALAEVLRDQPAVTGVVAHRHPPAAPSADGHALQEGGSLPRRAGPPVLPAGLRALGQAGEVGLVAGPGDVAGMRVGDEGCPLVTGHQQVASLAVGEAPFTPATVGEGTGVARVVQDVQHPVVFQGLTPNSPEGNFGYQFPNLLIDHAMRNTHVQAGFWRGVNVNHNAIYSECFIDEVAEALGQDKLAFRLKFLKPKHAAVLKAAAEKAGWGTPAPQGVWYRSVVKYGLNACT